MVFWKLALTSQYTFIEAPDIGHQVLPWLQVQSTALHKGVAPLLWDPYIGGGQPLAGQLQPSGGQIFLNGQSLYPNLDNLKRYISYIPQEDAFDEHLTIGENLQFAAAIRSPHLSRRDRTRRLESKLIELGLGERRDAVVGSAVKKTLSGGERKRLNIGLDMIGMSDVYLFDEPTSGLSS